jgi:hypothetical protein
VNYSEFFSREPEMQFMPNPHVISTGLPVGCIRQNFKFSIKNTPYIHGALLESAGRYIKKINSMMRRIICPKLNKRRREI